MASSESADLRFGGVLEGRSAGRRTTLLVLPIVAVIVGALVFAGVSISRTSGLETQLRIAQQQVVAANQVVEERDRQLRDARGETAALAAPGQGAAVLGAASGAPGASGVVLTHPAEHALAVYAYDLAPAPAGRQYRLVVTDGAGQETLLDPLMPNDRGAAFLLARNVPEGLVRVEIALVPESAAGAGGAAAKPDTHRQPVLTGTLPRPGEDGVVLASGDRDAGAPRANSQVAGRRGR